MVWRAGYQKQPERIKFSGQAGQVTVSYDKATVTTNIYLDVDGDRTADLVIQLSGHVNLTGGDFIR